MKKLRSLSKMKMGLIAAVGVSFAGLGLLQYAAAAGTLKLQPSASTVNNGSNVSVEIRIAPDQPVDGVEASITYDQSKLQCVSVDTGGSAFPIQLVNSGCAATIQVTRGHLTGTVSGDALVATITFKALAGSGSTSLNVTGNATSAGAYINPGFQGATISLAGDSTPPPPPDPDPDPDPDPTPDPDPDPTPDPGPDPGTDPGGGGGEENPPPPPPPGDTGGGPTKPPTTGNGNCKDITIQKKKIELKRAMLHTSAVNRCRMYVIWGPSHTQLAASTNKTDLGTEHDISFDEALLIPGTTFYYKVVAEDEQGNKVETAVEAFKTKGYSVMLIVKDESGKAVAKKKLVLHSEPITAQTDSQGTVTFENVAPGIHKVEYEQGGKTYSENVTVADAPILEGPDGAQSADLQTAEVTFKGLAFVSNNFAALIMPISILAGLALLGGAAFLIIKRRQDDPLSPSYSGTFSYTEFPHAPDNTPHVQAPSSNQGDDLIHKVKGVDKPDPGAVVTPHDDDNDRQP